MQNGGVFHPTPDQWPGPPRPAGETMGKATIQ
jgi:hypothetical protein